MAQTWLINNLQTTKNVSLRLFINYSQHCGSLPRLRPKWLRDHMLRLSFSLTQISKWISYWMENRCFHAFPQRAVNQISYYTGLHYFVRMSPMDKTIQFYFTEEVCIGASEIHDYLQFWSTSRCQWWISDGLYIMKWKIQHCNCTLLIVYLKCFMIFLDITSVWSSRCKP